MPAPAVGAVRLAGNYNFRAIVGGSEDAAGTVRQSEGEIMITFADHVRPTRVCVNLLRHNMSSHEVHAHT